LCEAGSIVNGVRALAQSETAQHREAWVKIGTIQRRLA
jgi:hypothetical protein